MSEDLVSIQQRTKSFAVRVIRAYVQLSKKHFDEQLPKEAKSCFTHDDGTFVPWESVIEAILKKWNEYWGKLR